LAGGRNKRKSCQVTTRSHGRRCRLGVRKVPDDVTGRTLRLHARPAGCWEGSWFPKREGDAQRSRTGSRAARGGRRQEKSQANILIGTFLFGNSLNNEQKTRIYRTLDAGVFLKNAAVAMGRGKEKRSLEIPIWAKKKTARGPKGQTQSTAAPGRRNWSCNGVLFKRRSSNDQFQTGGG